MTDGPGAALKRAKRVARGKHVAISGGAGTAKQFISSGLVDEIMIHPVPVFLGAGVRLFDGPTLTDVRLEQDAVVVAPGLTHLTYRVSRKRPAAGQS